MVICKNYEEKNSENYLNDNLLNLHLEKKLLYQRKLYIFFKSGFWKNENRKNFVIKLN